MNTILNVLVALLVAGNALHLSLYLRRERELRALYKAVKQAGSDRLDSAE